jgi:large subunit ribosomal protein L6
VEIREADGAKTAVVGIDGAERQAKANWGTMASLVKNALRGVTEGFEKKLQLEGIGYRAQVEGSKVTLALGFSHPVEFPLPQGITASIAKNIMTISGISKELVGKIAAELRMLKKPEPYQGKGIRYVGEVVRRKAGKKAAVGAKA